VKPLYWWSAMPWTSHLSQQVIIAEIVSSSFSSSSILPFPWLLVGTLFPDYFLVGKAWIYFKDRGSARVGLVGAGHSIVTCLAVTAIISLLTPSGSMAFLVGSTSHILSDLADSKGCALWYPCSNSRSSFKLWHHAADKGLFGDMISFCGDWKALGFELVFGIWALVVLAKWL